MDFAYVFEQIEEAIRPFPKAAMFELAEEGFDAPFEQLIGCILSIRTRDEAMLPTAKRLFAVAHTANQIANLPISQLTKLISTVGLYQNKAKTIHAIATDVVANHRGELPCDRELLLSFKGVGPKCANLALGIACQMPFISVDVHVHRITNRWGLVATTSPEKTMTALMERLPQQYWIDINRLLVGFGKHLCVGKRPFCTTCPLFEMCPRIGVEAYR
ncbi:MAG: endonuclease III [Chloroflexota bacterium]